MAVFVLAVLKNPPGALCYVMKHSPGAWARPSLCRLALLAVCVVVRLGTMLLLLYEYMDGSIDPYRKYRQIHTSMWVADAVAMVTPSVASTTFYLPMMSMAYLVTILTSGLSYLEGVLNVVSLTDWRPEFCRQLSAGAFHTANVLVYDFWPFCAWIVLAPYLAFSCLSYLAEVLFLAAGLSERWKLVKMPVANSSSERRKLSRMEEQEHAVLKYMTRRRVKDGGGQRR